MPGSRLSLDDIIEYLDKVFEVEFSYRNTRPAAKQLALLPRANQDYILDWAKRIASTNIELAYQFSSLAPALLETTDLSTLEAWALHAMDIYDRQGLRAAVSVIQKIDEFRRLSHEHAVGAVFEREVAVLLPFVQGLSGRKLKLQESDITYTDTQTLYLPAIMAQLANARDNFRLYKATVAYLWAQTRFGTFRVNLAEHLLGHDKPEDFLRLFHALEHIRLDACLQRELPGLHRDIQHLKQQLEEPTDDRQWQQLTEQLSEPHVTAHHVLALAEQHLDRITPPAMACYAGHLQPDAVASCMSGRIKREKNQLRMALRDMLEEQTENAATEPQPASSEARKFEVNRIPDASEPDGMRIELRLEDQPVAPPDVVKSLMTSILQDLGDIPEEYLYAAGDGEYDATHVADEDKDPDDVWAGTYHEEGAFLYKEWDYRRQHYRKNWCAAREKTVSPVYDSFVADTLHKYYGLIKHLRKTFEAMRNEDRMLKRQVHGDDIDIDALVEAVADSLDGSEMTDRLFTRMHRTERNIAVVFMVDMSGSTKGWINDAERESLLLLCESLETLGDRYAIYGFSGMTRKRCEIYKIKEFSEAYNEEVRGRITGITPQDYTRMGFAIRHLTKILNEVDAKTRILITLSDGKPDDYDNYRGEYGIEDTRRALIEARREMIHPYCITIDKEARDYLAHMYGPAAYTVIDDVSQLPLKVSDIYRRLTT